MFLNDFLRKIMILIKFIFDPIKNSKNPDLMSIEQQSIDYCWANKASTAKNNDFHLVTPGTCVTAYRIFSEVHTIPKRRSIACNIDPSIGNGSGG